jgi:hypothetical protein
MFGEVVQTGVAIMCDIGSELGLPIEVWSQVLFGEDKSTICIFSD